MPLPPLADRSLPDLVEERDKLRGLNDEMGRFQTRGVVTAPTYAALREEIFQAIDAIEAEIKARAGA